MAKVKKTFLSLFILGFSLFLFTSIGIGEAYRTYSKLKMEEVYAIGETIKSVVDSFLGAGVPLKQFTGFDTVSSMILDIDSSITNMSIVDNHNRKIFPSGPDPEIESFRPAKNQDLQNRFITDENKNFYRISIPLESKFEKVGELRFEILRNTITKKILDAFKPVFVVILIVMGLFWIQIYLIDKKGIKNQKLWFTLAYIFSTVIVSLFILFALINIYNNGIQKRTQNLANSLTHKLSYIKKLDLDINSFKGIDKLFNQYNQLNKEISYIALKVNNKVVIHTNTTGLKKASDYIRYTKHLNHLAITIWVDKQIIYKNLWLDSKAFLILFVAAFFMAALCLNLLFAFAEEKRHQDSLFTDKDKEQCLALIKPLFFLGVFVEGLYASFLPQYFNTITQDMSISGNATSLLFTVFFISYGLILFPAANYCQKHGEKKAFFWSVIFIGISSILMAFYTNYYVIILLRLIAGLCQGVLFIAVQSYILRITPENRKTQSIAILIIQYNGGRIAGTAIGALAVTYFDIGGVFVTGGIISFFLGAYVLKFIPKIDRIQEKIPLSSEKTLPKVSFFDGMKSVLKDIEHLKTSFLIGVNAKMVMIGVVCFALPLIMERKAFSKEDIGFILILYSAGVLISSVYSSKLADKTGNIKKILFRGNQGSGLGLILIGIIGLPGIQLFWSGPLLVMGSLVLGLAHGFIAAPITTHITETRTSAILGKGPAISIFRVFERAGNILGPLIVGFLLMMNNYNSLVLSYIGGFILVCGFLFIIKSGSGRVSMMLILLIFVFGITSKGFCGAGQNRLDWFQFTKDMPEEWEVITDKKDPFHFILSPDPEKHKLMDKKILILIPKKSSAYVTSTEAVLNFFSDKKLYPIFEIVNFNKDKTRGKLALKTAQEKQMDLIFAMGSMSVDFVYKNFQNQKIPVVTICAKDPVMMNYIADYNTGSKTNFAFTSINIPVKLQMVYFKELIPDLKNIGILYAKENTSAVVTQVTPLKEYAQTIGIKVIEIIVEDQKKARIELGPKLKHAIEEMKTNDADLQKSIFWVTGSTSVFSNFDIINQHSDKVPVIGASPSMVKGGNQHGALMAIGVGFENNAQLASIYAEKILKHQKKPGEFKVGVISPPDIAINFKMVKNINMKIPYGFFELTNLIFNYRGEKVKSRGSILSDQ
ncbi:MAG: MFS transporter [Desulfobacteraceae bacterium]|nr:MFS transporter [Desulfobacteraceae bacterium]